MSASTSTADKCESVTTSAPARSTHTVPVPLTITSLTRASASRCCNGPNADDLDDIVRSHSVRPADAGWIEATVVASAGTA